MCVEAAVQSGSGSDPCRHNKCSFRFGARLLSAGWSEYFNLSSVAEPNADYAWTSRERDTTRFNQPTSLIALRYVSTYHQSANIHFI